MDIKGVITGDIVGSTHIATKWREQLLNDIHDTITELMQIDASLRIEFYRGDSFQIVSGNPQETLRIAILLRARLISSTPKGMPSWDARLSIGIGEVSFTSEHIVTSDGEAFRLSGRGLDEIGKQRLQIKTQWETVNEELKVSTSFADDIISGWSVTQSKAVYYALLNRAATQKEIGQQIGSSYQNVSKLLVNAKISLIEMYIDRYSTLIQKKLSICTH